MVQFQIIDIDFDDIDVSNRPPELLEEECMTNNLFESMQYSNPREFVITIYGITNDGKKIVCNVYNYHPYFYVNFNTKKNKKISENKTEKIIESYINNVIVPVKETDKYYKGKKFRKLLYGNHIKSRIMDECNNISRKDFFYYSNKKKSFYKMTFNTYQTFKTYAKAIRLFSKNNKAIEVSNKSAMKFIKASLKKSGKQSYKLYESNIHPLIRFLHFYNIKPSSWIEIDDSNIINTTNENKRFNCDIEININIKDDIDFNNLKEGDPTNHKYIINPIESNNMANIKIASFDIECDSSHGEFPLPIKTFKKLAVDVYDRYHFTKKTLDSSALLTFKSIKNNDILDGQCKCIYISILILIGTLQNSFSIEVLKTKILDISDIFTDISKEDKNSQLKLMFTQLEFNNKNKDGSIKTIEDVREVNNINKVYLKNNKMEIMIENIFSTIWNNYRLHILYNTDNTDVPILNYKHNLIYLFDNAISNRERDYNINILDFIISNYKTIRLTDDMINYIIPDDYLDNIIDQYPRTSIGNENSINTDKFDYKLNPIELYKTINNIEKKQYIIRTIFNNKHYKRGLKYHSESCNVGEGIVCEVEGDKIIQIGIVFHNILEKDKFYKHIIVIPYDENTSKEDVCEIEGNDEKEQIKIHRCITEKELMHKFTELIHTENPDLLTGYNVFGFDFDYMNKRAEEIWVHDDKDKEFFYDMGRLSKRIIKENIGSDTNTINEYNKEWGKKCRPVCKTLSSSGLGDNDLTYIHMNGRVLFDVQKEVQKNYKLDSYKLDNVSSHFIRGTITNTTFNMTGNKYTHKLNTSYTGPLESGNFITLSGDTNIGEQKYMNNKKFKIIECSHDELITIESADMLDISDINQYKKLYWCECKDDIPPQKIFDYHKGIQSDNEIKRHAKYLRGDIAKYCVKDSLLVILITLKQDFITNNIGMSNVCRVPLSYIFLRGQGVKAHSVVSYKSTEMKYLIPDISNYNDEQFYITNEYSDDTSNQSVSGWYEGAIVLPPKKGIYLEDPISVLDFTSLYPSSIIEKNLSPETFLGSMEYNAENTEDSKYSNEKYFKKYIQDETDYKYNKVEPVTENEPEPEPEPDYTYVKVEYNNYTSKDVRNAKYPNAECRYICHESNKLTNKFGMGDVNKQKRLGIIPQVLSDLLSARSKTKKKLKLEKDPERKKILDGRQLALKLTANSIYGQLGARTSPIYFKEIAACCTAVGRFRINDAVEGLKQWAHTHNPPLKFDDSNVIYGDTDSVFVKFDTRIFDNTGLPTGDKFIGEDAVKRCIDLGRDAQDWMDGHNLEGTGQCLEYEKTFWPLILISKKRYVGNKYEFNHTKCYRDSNGIVLKRRDNAPIVKYIYGNVIEKIITEKSVYNALKFLEESLKTLDDSDKFPVNYFVISKTLRGYYKCPPAHKILADRMKERDPGTAPKSNDRLPYVFIKLSRDKLWRRKTLGKKYPISGDPFIKWFKKDVKQGDKIEHIDYYVHNNKSKKITLDYTFYITNQIMNSVIQVLDDTTETSDNINTIKYPKKASQIFTEIIQNYKEKYGETDPNILPQLRFEQETIQKNNITAIENSQKSKKKELEKKRKTAEKAVKAETKRKKDEDRAEKKKIREDDKKKKDAIKKIKEAEKAEKKKIREDKKNKKEAAQKIKDDNKKIKKIKEDNNTNITC